MLLSTMTHRGGGVGQSTAIEDVTEDIRPRGGVWERGCDTMVYKCLRLSPPLAL